MLLLVKAIDNILNKNITSLERINNIVFSYILFKFNTQDIDDNISLHIKNEWKLKYGKALVKNLSIDDYVKLIDILINSKYNTTILEIKPSIFTIEILEKLKQCFNEYKDKIIEPNKLIKIIYDYYLNKDTLQQIKDYEYYYNNDLMVEWILDYIKIGDIKYKSLLEGNIKINSYTQAILHRSKNIDKSNFHRYQENPIINTHINYELYPHISNAPITTNIIFTDIFINNKPTKYDFIIFDTITKKHNIIHASCCDRIKNFKIRGTNYESLVIQLIMSMLNKNGLAVICVPDSFLFSDSNQLVETRKYLIENFKISSIIQLDEDIYKIKGYKKSIIIFENKGQTEEIIYKHLYNKLEANTICTINLNTIRDNNYSLYYKLYDMKTPNNNSIVKMEYTPIENIFKFHDKDIEIKDKVLVFDKYYNNNDSIKIIDTNENQPISLDYHLILEECTDEYIKYFPTYYLEYILKQKTNLFLKGKLNQIDINKIKKIQIPKISKEMQISVNTYYTQAKAIYKFNLKQIDNYIDLKKNLFNMLFNVKYVRLDSMCSIYSKEIEELPVMKDLPQPIQFLIEVVKNSSLAGTVKLLENVNISENKLSNNSYYLLVNDDVLIQYIYYYMWFIMNKIIELAQLNTKPTLNIGQLSSLSIPIVNTDIMNNIISYCCSFDNSINKITLENETMKDKDILTLISQIYNFSPFVQ